LSELFKKKREQKMQASEDQKIQQNEAIGSIQPIGTPWSTGLFDCHEDQTNGSIYSSLVSLNKLYN